MNITLNPFDWTFLYYWYFPDTLRDSVSPKWDMFMRTLGILTFLPGPACSWRINKKTSSSISYFKNPLIYRVDCVYSVCTVYTVCILRVHCVYEDAKFTYLKALEDTARYAGLLLAPAEGFGLWPRLFLPFGQKKELFMLFWPIFGVQ